MIMARKAKDAPPKQESLPEENITSDKVSKPAKSVWTGPGNLIDKGRIVRPGDELPQD